MRVSRVVSDMIHYNIIEWNAGYGLDKSGSRIILLREYLGVSYYSMSRNFEFLLLSHSFFCMCKMYKRHIRACVQVKGFHLIFYYHFILTW